MPSPKRASETNQILTAISDLAQATGKGFEDSRKRLDGVTSRLDDIQAQITRIETHILSDHQRRLDRIEHKLGI